MTTFFIALLIWAVCGFVAFAATLGHFQGEFPTVRNANTDTTLAVTMGLFGPIGLLVAAWGSDGFKHGFKLTAEGPVDRWGRDL